MEFLTEKLANFVNLRSEKYKIMLRDSLKKMSTELLDVVNYQLNINGKNHLMNDYLEKKIKISWKGLVICHCGKEKRKLFRSGFCYNCYWTLPEASPSIFKPELCTAHLGIEERDLTWEKEFQLTTHYVYLANSSGIKVGITRASQGVVRWMDQGASQAILLAKVPNRRFSGDIEVALKPYVSDKTNWRKMLSGEPNTVDLVKFKHQLIKHVPSKLKKYILDDDYVTEIRYPVQQYPKKIKSVKLEKSSTIEGLLLGIKGQYLILDQDRVFNVRSHEGFVVDFSIMD